MELRKDGIIITNKGTATDVKFLEEDDPRLLLNQFQDSHNEEVRKIKNPDLNPTAAFKKTAAYKKGYRNIYFSRQTQKDIQKFGPSVKIPTYMQNLGRRHQMSISTDKALEMNDYISQSHMDLNLSGFNTQTQSQLSKLRYKNIIRNR